MLLTTTSKINAIKEFMKAGDYDSAVDIAEKVNPERVSSVRDLMTIAHAYLKKHRYEDAKVVYVEMHNHATTHKVMVGLIELCLKTNCPEEAEGYIREFRKLEPTNPERLVFRYRVDVQLGKGPEYLVKSLSKLKDEDYSDVWGLELAKEYFKMEEYQKCAQECKDLLLWFQGTESAAKAHILLSACIERGATISMPEPRAAKVETLPDDENENMDVPLISADNTAAAEEESDANETAEETSKESFFDIGAVIEEMGEQPFATEEEADKETASELKQAEEQTEESIDETAEEQSAMSTVGSMEESIDGQNPMQTEASAEAIAEYLEAADAVEETEETEEPEPAEVLDVDEGIPEDATETLSFLANYSPEEIKEAMQEAEKQIAEEKPYVLPEDATVPIFLPKEGQPVEENDIDVDAEFDLIGLAVRKAKQADDDDDDIVIKDYFPEDILIKSPLNKLKRSTPTIDPVKEAEEKAAKEAEARAAEEKAAKEAEARAAEEAARKAAKEAEEKAAAEAARIAAEEAAQKAEEEAAESAKIEFMQSLSDSFEHALSADNEESDGQMSFFNSMKDEEDVRLTFDMKNDSAENDAFVDLADNIAQAVQDEMENGTPEVEVSTEPTKVHGDLTAQALDAMLREDDDAIEKALYGLLSDK